MSALRYVTGDATAPDGDDLRVIAHVCNDVGAWGAGFVMALSARWMSPEVAYLSLFANDPAGPGLGHVQLVPVGVKLAVANLVAQHGVGPDHEGRPPIRYDALEACLTRLTYRLLHYHPTDASLHVPRLGCGLAGGTWDRVEPLLEQVVSRGVPVTVYDLPVAEQP